MFPSASALNSGSGTTESNNSVHIKTEPNEDNGSQETYDFNMEEEQRIKTELLLYGDHEIKDEMVIGPTEIQYPETETGSQGNDFLCSVSKQLNVSKRLFSCKIQLKDVANELWCASCDKWCLTSAELQRHKKTHSLEKDTAIKYHDTTTDRKQKHTLLSKKPSLEKNISETSKKTHFSASKNLFACDCCKKIFQQKMDLEYHIAVNHNENNRPFTCNNCNESFNNKRLFSKHLLCHNKELSYCCQKCKKIFKLERYYLQHLSSLCGSTNKRVRKSEIKYIPQKIDLDNNSSNRIDKNIKTSFSCDICDKQFTFKVNLDRHQRLLHTENNQIFSCYICDKKFTSKRYLDGHIQTHSEKRQHWCDICKKGFQKRVNLDYHLYAIHKSGKTFEEMSDPCKVCDKDLSKPLLWKHKLIHRGERLNDNIAFIETIKNNENIFLCNVCQKIYYKNSCLNYHKALRDCRESGNVVDKSNIVGYYSTGQKLRGRSKLIRQGGEKKHQCDTCDKRFWTRYELKIHNNIHNNIHIGTFICDYCKKAFITKLKLAYHIKIHDKILGKQFSCEICKKSYAVEDYLKRHQILHTNAWSCKTCKKQFYCKYHLQRHCHTKLHLYSCDICNKKIGKIKGNEKSTTYCIRGREGMVRHVECHKSENFTCDVCDKVFPNEMYLLEHWKCHSENLVICEICNKVFIDENQLNQHLNVHI